MRALMGIAASIIGGFFAAVYIFRRREIPDPVAWASGNYWHYQEAGIPRQRRNACRRVRL